MVNETLNFISEKLMEYTASGFNELKSIDEGDEFNGMFHGGGAMTENRRIEGNQQVADYASGEMAERMTQEYAILVEMEDGKEEWNCVAATTVKNALALIDWDSCTLINVYVKTAA